MTPTLNLGILASGVVTAAGFGLFAWGRNSVGELGDGTTTTRTSPTQVGSNTTWTSIATGWDQVVNLNTFTLDDFGSSNGVDGGKLYGWGRNNLGQLGDGTTTDRTSGPVQIGSDTDWILVVASSRSVCAVKTNGKLYSWGDNTSYALGDGTLTQRNSPVQIGSDTDWQRVAHGAGRFGLAIKTNGKLYSWGDNDYGNLGLGDTADRTSPTQVGSDTDWASVAANRVTPFFSSFAIKTNGKLYAWGSRTSGKLGDGNTSGQTLTPTQVGSDTDWQSVSAGANHTLALKTDGRLYGCGNNGSGQIGDGTTTARSTLVQVGSDSDWAAVSAGYDSSFAVKTNGKLYAWGANNTNQLGDGTTTQRTSPVQIGSVTTWSFATGNLVHGLGLR